MQTINPPSYTLADWRGGYCSLAQEHSYWIDDVQGTIPAGLSGTLFRNGPGLLERGGQSLQHPFDGDGMICAFTFKDGRVHFRNRYVRTAGYLAEQKAGKFLYRGVFGTPKPGGWLANAFDLRLKNIANTHVVYWGGKLLALWEAALPYRLDPATLETLGLDTLDGILGSSLAAHPRIDRVNGEPRLVDFAIQTGLSSVITLYELDAAGHLVNRHSHPVGGFAFIHDFALTPNYCLFFQNPVRFNPLPFLLGWRGAGECLEFRTQEPTRVLVIPRSGQGKPQILQTPAGFVFHHANAWENQPDQITVDSICYASLPGVDPNQDFRHTNFDALDPGQLWRFQLDLTTGQVQRRPLGNRCCEFPTLHPDYVGQPYRYLYAGAAHNPTGNAPLQALMKFDLATGQEQVWSAAPRGFVGEPVFVPRGPGEEEGWILSLGYDAAQERSFLVILDAADFSRGPLARLTLRHAVPYGLHGSFVPSLYGSEA